MAGLEKVLAKSKSVVFVNFHKLLVKDASAIRRSLKGENVGYVVAKKSLFSYPFIGWNMWLNRYISLERGKNSSMRQMMADAAKAIREKNSVMVFPEGTRSKDGNLQHFKTGAFHLALDNAVPILPVAISGTSKAIRKGGFLINKNFNIRAVVLDPIPYSVIAEMSPKEVAMMVEQKIAAVLEKS